MRTWIDNLENRTVQIASTGQLATVDNQGNLEVAGIKISKAEIDWLYKSIREQEAKDAERERLMKEIWAY